MEPDAPPADLEILCSRGFPDWLAAQRVSLALTTYQSGKLFLIGLQADGRLSIHERTFPRAMGLWATDQTIYLGTDFQLWRLENCLEPGQRQDGYDRVYVPRVGFVTGDLDIHDIVVEGGGRVVFVNTLFGCLATVSSRYSFCPLWVPPFLSGLAPEDRCHLNGLAVVDGRARFVTSVSRTDVADGWRDRRRDGGVVMDVRTDQTVVEGLSMPHSPRWYRDRLWLLDSGSGYFGWVHLERGSFERIAFCPGYLRGLGFSGDYAVVGLSKARDRASFSGLSLDDNLRARGGEPRCGLQVIELGTGAAVHWVRIGGLVEELYDVAVLPGVERPMAVGFKTDQIQRIVSVGPAELLVPAT